MIVLKVKVNPERIGVDDLIINEGLNKIRIRISGQ